MGTTKKTDKGAEMLDELRRFFKEKPGVSLYFLCNQSGLKYTDWHKILTGERGLTPHYEEQYPKLKKEMMKYGFE